MYDIDKIIEILKQTVKTNPKNTDARLQLASILLNKDSFEEAKSHFETVLKENPEDIEALFGMGKCSFYLQDLSDTRIFLGKLLKLTENNHAEANLIMAKAYIELEHRFMM